MIRYYGMPARSSETDPFVCEMKTKISVDWPHHDRKSDESSIPIQFVGVQAVDKTMKFDSLVSWILFIGIVSFRYCTKNQGIEL
jgi:hypothetical protein